MITLEFKNGLISNRFTFNNEYNYSGLEGMNIYYKDSEEEIPFIMTATNIGIPIHNGEIMYSTHGRQLGGRTLTTNKIKEILDGSKVPLIFNIGSRKYLIGKGFIAYCLSNGDFEVLFMAVSKRKVDYIGDVKYYVSRSINIMAHKKLHPVIKDFSSLHPGDVITTCHMEKYIGSKIDLPSFSSRKEKLEYEEIMINQCFRETKKLSPKLSVKMIEEDPKKKKKAKETEILEALRAASPVPIETRDIVMEALQDESYHTTAHSEGLPY